jgi:arylsulfatase A
MSSKTTAFIFLAFLFSHPLLAAEKPNIVLVLADDFGFECVGANGGKSYPTPNLDKLAAEGARFTHCYSQPLCTPTRVQIMTGLYNYRNYTRFSELAADQKTFGHFMKSAGYATCLAHKWQLGREKPDHFGFDEYAIHQPSTSHWGMKIRVFFSIAAHPGRRSGVV